MGKTAISKRRTTLDDVARLARVSPITVSRALRRPDVVSPELRSRIEAAVAKLAYVPNVAASRLASSRSHAVGVIVPTLYNVIFAEYLSALHEFLLPAGFQVLVVNSRYSLQEEEDAVRTLLGQRVEAIIIVGVTHSDMARRLLTRSRIPVIETFQLSPDPIGLNIGLDHKLAGRDATRHLLRLGHSRVSFICGHLDERAGERMAGYKMAMDEADLSAKATVNRLPRPSTIALGAEIMGLLAADAKVPQALYCIDDNLALGALQQCRRMGLRLPEDIAILGFHDLEFASCSSPSLSSVATYRYETGKLAAESAIGMIAGGRRKAPAVIDMGYQIIDRQSTTSAT